MLELHFNKPFQRPGIIQLFDVIIVLIISVCIAYFLSGCTFTTNSVTISLGQAITLSQSHNLEKVVVDSASGTMLMTVTAPSQISVTDMSGKSVNVSQGSELTANIDSLNMADLQTLGFLFPPDSSTNATSSGSSAIWIFIVPTLLIIGVIFLLSRSGKSAQNQAMSFGRSRARLVSPDRPKITFADVAGVEEAKEDLMEEVEFLKNRQKFQTIGASIPKGVLLIGPPGTGKTLLARAVAGEAGVPFFSVSGSEFVEMFVGIGAARVRDLFDQAKRNSPCILFIDEIDAVGRQRAGAIPGSHEEREQTLNQILVEMDGFDPNVGVIVLAATNRVDVLDPALLRPGRFDRRVILDNPDTNGRLAILKIHSKGKKMDKSVDLAIIAKETHGFSGADIAELMNEAAILAVRRKKEAIGMLELEDSIDRVLAGPERKSLKIKPKDKELTAYHESGHALVAHMLKNVAPVHKISIVARGSMGGYTRLLEEDRYFVTKSQLEDTLATCLAGHTAELLTFNEVSTGPHSDIRQVTDIARKMITEYGMSEKLGVRTFGYKTVSGYLGIGVPEEKDYSEDTARQMDEELHDIIEKAREVSRKILEQNKSRLAYIAEKLMQKETLEGPELEAAFTDPLPEKAISANQGIKSGEVKKETQPVMVLPGSTMRNQIQSQD